MMKKELFAKINEAIENGTEIEITQSTIDSGIVLGVVPVKLIEESANLISILWNSVSGKSCFIQIPINEVAYESEINEWLIWGDHTETGIMF